MTVAVEAPTPQTLAESIAALSATALRIKAERDRLRVALSDIMFSCEVALLSPFAVTDSQGAEYLREILRVARAAMDGIT